MTAAERALLLSIAEAVYALMVNAIGPDAGVGLERYRDDVAATLATVEAEYGVD